MEGKVTNVTSPFLEIRSYALEAGDHVHDFAQAILPCAGVMELETDRGAGRVTEAIAAFVPAGTRHAFAAERSARFAVLDLIGADDAFAPPAFFPVTPELRGLIDCLRAAERRPLGPQFRTAWACLAFDCLANRPARPDRDAAALARARAFMDARLDRALTVEEIADAAGVSARTLHRIVRAKARTTPHGWLAALRLDAAERLLVEGRLPVAEIALMTGHADQSALTRAMRRRRGVTPARWRKRASLAVAARP